MVCRMCITIMAARILIRRLTELFILKNASNVKYSFSILNVGLQIWNISIFLEQPNRVAIVQIRFNYVCDVTRFDSVRFTKFFGIYF